MVVYNNGWYIVDNVVHACYLDEPEIELPRGILGIWYYAFTNRYNLRCAKIPEGVRYIRDGAFMGCFRLERVILPRSLRVIGDSAFADCSALKELNLPEGLTQIGYQAFAGTALERVDLPPRLTRTMEEPFMDCRNLKRVIWPYQNGSLLAYGAKALWGILSNPDLRIYANKQRNLDNLPVHVRDAALRGFAEQYLQGALPERFPQKAWLRALREKEDLNGMEIVIACLEGIRPPEQLPDAIASLQAEGDPALVAHALALQNRILGASGDAAIDRLYQEVFDCHAPA